MSLFKKTVFAIIVALFSLPQSGFATTACAYINTHAQQFELVGWKKNRLKVVHVGDAILRQRCDKVTREDRDASDFKIVVANMKQTLHASGGVGLAAPVPEYLSFAKTQSTKNRLPYF